MFKQMLKCVSVKIEKNGERIVWTVYSSLLEAQVKPIWYLEQVTHLTSRCVAV